MSGIIIISSSSSIISTIIISSSSRRSPGSHAEADDRAEGPRLHRAEAQGLRAALRLRAYV